MTGPEKKFLWTWKACQGPELLREFRFHHARQWRFDFALPAARLAYEIEGGIWRQARRLMGPGGRHNRPAGFKKDCQKYLQATLAGWTVFRLTPDMVTVANLTQLVQFAKQRTP